MEQAKYFSVKFAVKILGVRYVPCVCYRLDSSIEATIQSEVEKGNAKLYAEKIRFVSGRPVPVYPKSTLEGTLKMTPTEAEAPVASAQELVNEVCGGDISDTRGRRKPRRDFA